MIGRGSVTIPAVYLMADTNMLPERFVEICTNFKLCPGILPETQIGVLDLFGGYIDISGCRCPNHVC